ncbi:MAG: DUF2461 family protein, partial [Pseudomonadota bacterium]
MAAQSGFQDDAFAFFRELSQNNDRDWFNANQKRFKDGVEAPFIALLEALSNRLSDAPRPLMGGKS